jgi:2-amino-4-hydroxy-6-hydroxymethyldihydropteridine diphosphokinase
MAKAFIGLGSNLGRARDGVFEDSQMQLHLAVDTITQHPKTQLLGLSSFYRTPAVGPEGQPDYINAVAALETSLSPIELLDFLMSVERQQGRKRTLRWGPRTLDLDILLYDQIFEDSERLTIPHPRLHERAFALIPLADLDPELVIPNGKNISQLLANCSAQGIVKLST